MVRPLKNLSEVVVIGGGLAGLSAARHSARLGHLVTLFERTGMYGVLVVTVGHVEGLPFPGHHSGQDLAIHLFEQAGKAGVRILDREVVSIDTGEKLALRDGSGEVHRPEAIIVASGASLKKLAVPGEDSYYGRGVSRCATCDGGFFRGQTVVVAGGGDAAVHEALELSVHCGRVIVVSHGRMRAKREYLDRLAARDNVEFVWDSEIAEILGDDSGVTGVRLRDVRSDSTRELPCMGVFPFIGVTPNTGFVPAALRDGRGLVMTDAQLATQDARIFAAGAARAGYGGNGVEAMAEGISAAESVAQRLRH